MMTTTWERRFAYQKERGKKSNCRGLSHYPQVCFNFFVDDDDVFVNFEYGLWRGWVYYLYLIIAHVLKYWCFHCCMFWFALFIMKFVNFIQLIMNQDMYSLGAFSPMFVAISCLFVLILCGFGSSRHVAIWVILNFKMNSPLPKDN